MRVLLVIDVQEAFLHDTMRSVERSTPDFEESIDRLLAHYRGRQDHFVVHVAHQDEDPTSLFNETFNPGGTKIQASIAPRADEPVFVKKTSSAATARVKETCSLGSARLSTNMTLIGALDMVRPLQLTLVGLESPHCVSSTARALADLYLDRSIAERPVLSVVYDATAAYVEPAAPGGSSMSAQTLHDATMTALHAGHAYVVTSQDVLSQ
ncbi:uncharacterized protein L969DRAFT_18630 [Mixia osmundae IAM 14324]|uniref:Isochorismatase-like domain-containing protein n=1 Tax=Mixia osmundae (strain CBS 9802 / IAM 14324 / JCM 22182 / KY 12970) TaxID=764103 RepID=G7EAB2_MIXOS|nr:uncharacterized protein L969DRAFT_18630 [Mixia osmundae IAM 14324]KEI37831.1 hypothetical protein L969DRAFT_18630 [Mixia osmundae IAM 14324]GAA99772.1 hypothetical protein E5Q_06475 [Mixia osmundae IAM 14324]